MYAGLGGSITSTITVGLRKEGEEGRGGRKGRGGDRRRGEGRETLRKMPEQKP